MPRARRRHCRQRVAGGHGDNGARAEEFRWQLPAGFPEPAVPADNPMSAAKVALGAKLFADPRLSITGQHSCAELPFARTRVHRWPRAFARRHRRRRCRSMRRRCSMSPTTLRSAGATRSCGRSNSRCAARLFNEHPRELGLAGREALVERAAVGGPARWCAPSPPRFRAMDQPVSMDNVIRAIAAYERTLFAGHSAFDRYVFGGDHGALSERQKAGMELFFSERTRLRALSWRREFRRRLGGSRPPAGRTRVRRYRHGRGGARAHAAQSAGDRALHA